MQHFHGWHLALFACGAIVLGSSALASPGDLDPTFANGGILSADIGCSLPPATSTRVAMVRDAQGDLYLVGFCTSPTSPPFSNQPPTYIKVMKLDANGDRVTAFGVAGIAMIDSTDLDSSTAATIDSSGNIYIVGQSSAAVGTVWKLDSDSGNLVAGFGTAGMKTINFNSQETYANAVVLDGNGSLYVAGQSSMYFSSGLTNTNNGFAVVKLDTNGNLVTDFGDGGLALFAPDAHTNCDAFAIGLDTTGYLYLAGVSEPDDGAGVSDYALAKIDSSSGALVTAFGSGGTESFDLGNNSYDSASALVLDGSGNMYVAGYTSVTIDANSARNIAAVVKVSTTSGALVAGFGNAGIKTIDLTGDGSTANALALDASGDLYVADLQADDATQTFDLLVSKLNSSGGFVTDFGSNGSKMFTVTGVDEASALLLDGNGHLYLSGVGVPDAGSDDATERIFLAARLLTANNVSTTTLTSSLNPAASGATVTFGAAVTGSGATPTGKVTFSDGGTVICANVALASGRATCATSALAASTSAHAISASYSGDSNNLGSISSVVEQMILGDEVFKNGFE